MSGDCQDKKRQQAVSDEQDNKQEKPATRRPITEEMNLQEKWYEQAKDMTLEELPEFLDSLINGFKHDYGTICHAMAAGALATMWAMEKTKQGGITGFQAGHIMWKFVRNWNYSGNKTGLRIIDYDNFLYPQYEHKFQKTISLRVWNDIQRAAKENIEKTRTSGYFVNEKIYQHWVSIVDGEVPFGFVVEE